MTPVISLWLPILVSSVFVFIVSSVIHMAPLWHRTDFPKMPDEEGVRDALRPLAIPPGEYMVPRPSSGADMRSPEFLEKMEKGPVAMMTVFPNGRMGMGRSLGLWFLYLIGVGLFAAFVAGRALPPGAQYRPVFKFVGVTALLAYAAALWQLWIWYRRSFSVTFKSSFDGLIYALVTAGTFGWLWPR
jgi:hypothetical protein